MKILVLNYEFPPVGCGGAAVAYELSKALIRKGNEVTVVTMAFEDLPRFEIREGIEIHRVKCLRKRRDACSVVEQFTYIVSAMLLMRRLLKEQKFEINHTHFIFPTGVLALWLKIRYKLPYIVTAHGSDVPGHNSKYDKIYKVLKPIWKISVKNAEYTVSPSTHLINLMSSIYANGNYKYICNGIDISSYMISEKKRKTILILCRLQESKGVQMVIEAFSKTSNSDWILQIVGDGPYRAELELLVGRLNLRDRVVFEGWIENKSERIIQILSEATVYVSASRFENCPISVLEAMASGVYPLLSNIEAHRCLVNKDNLFDINNEQSLIEKLEQIMHRSKIEYDFDKCKYDWDTLVIEYLALFVR